MVYRRTAQNKRLQVFAVLFIALLSATAIAQDRPNLDALSVVNSSGTQARLAAYLPDGPIILHFWATWCIPCREELPQVDAFRRVLAQDGLSDHLIVVSVDKLEFAQVATFIEDDLAIGLETLLVTDGNPGAIFGLFGYPYTLLLDADGTIVERFPGAIEWTAPDISARLFAHVD
ncbi:TlpA family protein disulfide reductase [Pelagibacterium halotolerans]|uniref:TlpA family protein disulfide reductase n=1 Tax=Pelagibacterium halotolerans TaxID=531813 RepID=UPI00384EDC0D